MLNESINKNTFLRLVPEVIKLFSCSTQHAEHQIYPAHNVKMPTIGGILTLISKMSTASESFKARKSFFFTILPFMSH